ncbi:MAG: hypothetical protein COW16_03280 [Sphingomonadales bacterium CG12_big_fil_rev_8_21_14_0_65_65_10]|jgi:hypothetical protein|uniref:Uncharacterized protein n=1 Tax=Blastomonas marina TaxID=1867408 RepID=A0ABQ1F8C3_9SPHN|nr:DUF5985 family protein [Blastomonas marina]PIW55937.1 MAG: hypothetical protein COW16_03280 [Sphingomonadales bacterium CG12_big_fil_rev_8_21_14_0_65_65_10]WPZ04632.1 DUF5985 family protein [Blastomonas marina]GGA03243.1 hypothetical protein GCM10010923_10110 [Blastomonas marina]
MGSTIPDLVYLLCFLTSALCAGLLLRQYGKVQSPVLLWSSACFTFLAIANLLVVVDHIIFPQADLKLARLVLTLLAVSVLLFGFIWEAEEDR